MKFSLVKLLDKIFTDGSQKTQIVDAGGEAATVSGGKLDVGLGSETVNVNVLNGLLPEIFDYVGYTNTNSTTDTFAFKSGGASGSLVATITIVYTDSTKTVLSTAART